MTEYILVPALALWLFVAARHAIELMQFFQQHEYDELRFLAWVRANLRKSIWTIEVAALPPLVVLAWAPFGGEVRTLFYLGFLVWVVSLLIGLFFAPARRQKAIKPLVFTARVKRLLGAYILIVVLEAAAAYALFGFPLGSGTSAGFALPYYLLYLVALTVIGQLAALNVVLANVLMTPVEAAVRRYYVAKAKRRLRAVNPIVIGITGSYGKTSTKTILAHILGSKFSVLATPESYNTLMGVCKVINTQLRNDHRYFVVEMGAYKPGDIASVCALVEPRIGILTAVGPQHLERFKTIENVAKAKNELIEALPEDGVAIINGDDAICERLAQAAHVRVKRYGLSNTGSLDLTGINLEVGSSGSRFDACSADGTSVTVHSVLLGRHNVSNILAAMLAATECGVPLRGSAQALASLPPVEHRLKPMVGPNGITYIDDAYNSNPEGAATALEVLRIFPGRKILVSPGIVELGPAEAGENEKFGSNAARSCDWVILVGDSARVGHIVRGLENAGFSKDRTILVDSLKEARVRLKEMVRPGDVILFENDLPDIY